MVDDEPERKSRQGGATDPTGHVSSGIQTGPLRGGDPRPGTKPALEPEENVLDPYRTGTTEGRKGTDVEEKAGPRTTVPPET